MKIKELPKEFEKKGVKYKQLVRDIYDIANNKGETKRGGCIIYKCEDIECGYSYYEVFHYKLHPQHPYSEEDYDMIEAYPTDNQFGLSAWCCTTKASLRRALDVHFDGDKYNIEKLA